MEDVLRPPGCHSCSYSDIVGVEEDGSSMSLTQTKCSFAIKASRRELTSTLRQVSLNSALTGGFQVHL